MDDRTKRPKGFGFVTYQSEVEAQNAMDGRAPKGIYLMEVFNMVYLGHDEVMPEEQLGTIRLTSSKGVQYLYNLPEKDVDTSLPSIKYQDDIVVTVKGPTCYFENLKMEFDLFSKAYTDTLEIKWNFKHHRNPEVLLKEKRIQSNDGTKEISVLLGLFGNAAVAALEVKLDKTMAGLDVYGVVVASNSKLDESKCASVLFARKPTSKIKLGTDGVIPLSKSHIAVPLDSVLYVDISLYVNGENHIATLPLKSKHFGDYKAQASPVFQVRVEWNAETEDIYSEYDLAFSKKSPGNSNEAEWAGEEIRSMQNEDPYDNDSTEESESDDNVDTRYREQRWEPDYNVASQRSTWNRMEMSDEDADGLDYNGFVEDDDNVEEDI